MDGSIFLYGAPASGKSTLGRRLADRLGAGFVDLDEAIVAGAGRSIPDIFAKDGEGAFRDLESRELARVAGGGRQVVSLEVCRVHDVEKLLFLGLLMCVLYTKWAVVYKNRLYSCLG